MLLVLQSVRRTPPVEQFYTLQTLVGKVVHPYLFMVHRSRPGGRSKHVVDLVNYNLGSSSRITRRLLFTVLQSANQ